jgi:glycerol uptake facilitator protein
MNMQLLRAYVVELVGVFGFVFFSAGVLCVNQMTLATGGTAGVTPQGALVQPGLLGLAVAQGVIYAVLLALTIPISGGYLNPAIAIMLWIHGRLNSLKLAWLLGAQLIGSVLAVFCLRYVFSVEIMRSAQFGAPHVNPLAYPPPLGNPTLLACTLMELLLTFFLVFAIFGWLDDAPQPADARQASVVAGAVLTACVLFAQPLTGAALNPARWFGPVFWDALAGSEGRPWADALVYLAGPILGALLGGFFVHKVYRKPG